jgi:hypothetical protein
LNGKGKGRLDNCIKLLVGGGGAVANSAPANHE